MFKKIQIWAFGLIILFFIIMGCSRLVYFEEKENPFTISTSFYPMYIMALNITRDIPEIEVVNLSQPDIGCLHDVQLTPAELQTLEKTDIFIINGVGMEGYLSKVLERLPQLNIVNASRDLDLNRLTEKEDGADPEHQGTRNLEAHALEAVNPHIWVSISLAIEQVKSIGQQLAELDPVHRDQYLSNTKAYVNKLETLKQKMHEGLSDIADREIITFHEAFPYFAQEFGLHITAVVQREPGSEPSAKELADTINLIRDKKVKAIFVEPQYSDKAAQTIARETQAWVYTLDPAVTGPADRDAYLMAMEKNLITLQEALRP